MTKQQLERTARAEIDRRRQQAETKAEAKRVEIYARVPELRILDEKQAAAGTSATRFALEGEKQKAADALNAVHDIARRRELLLAQNGYTIQDLQPQYSCVSCNDSGRMPNGKICSCYKEAMHNASMREINQSGPLRLCSFDNFRLDVYPLEMAGQLRSPRAMMAEVLGYCRDYAADFGPHSPSLYLFGEAGLGKTHLALSIASEVINKGYNVIYVSAQNVFNEISAARYGNDGIFRSLLEADLLVMDDLGTEFLDSYVRSRLYELVNTRMHRSPTIYTTNICRQDLLNQRYTEKIASRLLGDCEPLRFFGEDLRLQKLRQAQRP